MPTYGKKKVKDMVRSVLPSTARKGAKRTKDHLHRSTRRASKQEVQALAEDPETFIDYMPEDKDYDHEISMAVSNRRGADKTGPLMKWAPKVTKGKYDKRVAQLRQMLPKGTIGEHALGHIKHLKQFSNPNDPWTMKYRGLPRKKYISPTHLRLAWIKDMMSERPYLHAALNAAVKKSHSTERISDGVRKSVTGNLYPVFKNIGPKNARTLRGISDINDFVHDLEEAGSWSRSAKRDGSYHPEWVQALDKFIAKNPSVSIDWDSI